MRALASASAGLVSALMREVSQGRGGSRLDEARRLVGSNALAPDAHHLLALCASQAGRLDEAETAFQAALRLAPRQAMILSNFARFLGRQERWPEAERAWQEALVQMPEAASAWAELGLVQLALSRESAGYGRPSHRGAAMRRQAIASLRKALDLDASLVRAWHGLGSALRDDEDTGGAEHALRQALRLSPASPALWASLAGALRLSGRPAEAVEAYRQARSLGEVGPEVLDAEVGALIDCQRVDEARQASEELLRRFPAFVPAYSTRVNLLWEYGSGDTGQTEQEAPDAFFLRAVESQPVNADLHLGYISFLIEAKRGEEAFERLQILRRRQDHPRLLAMQANALEIAGYSERAAPLYAAADRVLGGQDLSFSNAYVRHLLKSGQWSIAAARAERTLALDPLHQETWAYLATAWRLLGDPREEWLCGFERLVALLPVVVPSGWRDMPQFLGELQQALEPLHLARAQPVAQSLRGGSQTPGRLFGRPEPRIEALRRALVVTIEGWLAELPSDPSHPFLGRLQSSVRFTGSWSVKLWRSGSHANHFHNEGWMSSAFYVALPPSVREGASQKEDGIAGALQLGQPPLELGLGLAPRRIIQPRVGHVALFPSYLWHGTVPFDDAEPRLTVAFDMLPAG